MGTVKIELDLPNFEKEIELKVIINKDGVQSSTPLIDKKVNKAGLIECGNAWKQQMPSQVTSGTEKLDAYGITQAISQTTQTNGYVAPSTVLPNQQQPTVTVTQNKIPSSMMGTF